MSIESLAMGLSEGVISIACVLQTVELLQIRESWSDHGIWRASDLSREFADFPRWLRQSVHFLFKENIFCFMLWIRLIAAFTLLFGPYVLLLVPDTQLFIPNKLIAIILLMTTLLICIRWRGTFNGGSDFMTVIVLTGIVIGRVAINFTRHGLALGLWYIAIHSSLSYFRSGLAKLKQEQWRNGTVLKKYLIDSNYLVPEKLVNKLSLSFKKESSATATASSTSLAGLAILTLVFECAFPLSILRPGLAISFIVGGAIFHLINYYVFGLNRFFFAWIATYPAILSCSLFSFRN